MDIEEKKQELVDCLESIDNLVNLMRNHHREIVQSLNIVSPGDRKTLNQLKTKIRKARVSGEQFRNLVEDAGNAQIDYWESLP